MPTARSSSKRGGDDTLTLSASKRAKTAKSEKEQLMETAQALQSELENQGVRMGIKPSTLDDLDMVVSAILAGRPLHHPGLAILEESIILLEPPDLDASDIHVLKRMIEMVNITRAELAQHYSSCFVADNAPPAPSVYNQHKYWAIWQKKDTAIQCGRPPEKRGLELSILDDVFRKFREDAESPWPKTEAGNDAFQLASLLCQVMPEPYDDDTHRGDAFHLLLAEFLSCSPSDSWERKATIKSQGGLHYATVDATLTVKRITLVIQETKVELGEGHDAFMQICRDYQIYVSSLYEAHPDHREQGASTFLICLIGPTLGVAGGFWDGTSTIVEPLARLCWMFEDNTQMRQNHLASLLYALKNGVYTLGSRQPVKGTFPSGVPRIDAYRSFQHDGEQKTHTLSFVKRLDSQNPHSRIFLAKTENPNELVLVKLVYGQYGHSMHRVLASEGLAPALHGRIVAPDSVAPIADAYIMEYLPPPSPDPKSTGWITLYAFEQPVKKVDADAKRSLKSRIWPALDTILKVMEEKSLVHGDFRSNNIMVEVESDGSLPPGDVKLRVIDFDWGGLAHEPRYPLIRNEAAAKWPGSPGGRIEIGHDRQLVKAWWDEFGVAK